MPPSPYRAALLAARKLAGDLEAANALRLARAMDEYARGIAARLKALGRTANVEDVERVLRMLSAGYLRTVTGAVAQGRTVSFERILGEWERAGREVMRASGVPDRLLGGLRAPPVTMLGLYEQIGGGVHWQTALRGHVQRGAAEANAIVRAAMAEGVGPDELGRRLRPYVDGSQPFQEAFAKVETVGGDVLKLDLSTVPRDLRGAAGQMRHNANRISFSELHNARAEAEVQHFLRDPFVDGTRWQLSPFRGIAATVPDECDVLAAADNYGMGPGVYPVAAVPSPPHPWDRCSRMPVTRDSRRIAEPKRNPPLSWNKDEAVRSLGAKAGKLTPAARRRIEQQAEAAVRFGEEARKALVGRRAG